jgi:hypothetical protein
LPEAVPRYRQRRKVKAMTTTNASVIAMVYEMNLLTALVD